MGDAITSYGLQVLLGLITLLAVWKDWKEYRKRSKQWGKPAQLVLASLAVLVFVLSLANTYYSRAAAAEERMGLNKEIGQLRADAQTADDGFRQSFAGLYDKFGQLQTRVQTDKLTKQNAALIRELDDAKTDLVAMQAKLNPPKLKLIASFGVADIHEIPTTEKTFPRVNGTVSVPIVVYNPSDTSARPGSIAVAVCRDCSYVSVPPGFVRVPGTVENQRNVDFQHILGNSYTQDMSFVVAIPAAVNHFVISLRVACENCGPADPQFLTVNVQ